MPRKTAIVCEGLQMREERVKLRYLSEKTVVSVVYKCAHDKVEVLSSNLSARTGTQNLLTLSRVHFA
jgi:hypothetical protein